MRVALTDWEVKGFWPGEPLWTTSVESTVQRRGVTPWVKARVPGGVHKALEEAGLIPDPWFGKNSLLCEWVENRWWTYRTAFSTPQTDQRIFLRFNGLDDHCWIYLNGRLLAEHTGIYEPAVLEATDLMRTDEQNQLLVIFDQPPREQGQIGWTSKTRTQKARFGYKWDFCTHLVNIGIWQGVWLETAGEARILSAWADSDVKEEVGLIRVRAEMDGRAKVAQVILSFRGQELRRETVAFASPWHPVLDHTLQVNDPHLWYPNGMGEQPLYDVRVVIDGGSDEWTGRIGIRSLRFRRCEGAEEAALPYQPVINGQSVYLRGVNVTPLDQRYGDVQEQDYRALFEKMRLMRVNAARVWGGGIIETETFYRLADENGILVWQEFIQSSSGIDNRPSHDPAYLSLLERNSEAAVRARRGHVSLTWWAGGNELTDAARRPVTDGDENILMLRQLVNRLDPGRLFLPASPSGPSFDLESPLPHHDVHGNWQYDGITKHYEKYNRADSMLQSEFGADGMSSVSQLRRILPPEDQQVGSMAEHPVFRHHGEWWETLLYRDEPLFGPLRELPHALEAWVNVSQLMQEEAIRYIVLANRSRRGRSCGSIIWQMNEPFPNYACTSLVEYYGAVKLAWYAVRRAYANTAVSLTYASLIQPAYAPVALTVRLDDLTGAEKAQVRMTAFDRKGNALFSREWDVALRDGRWEDNVSFALPQLEGGVFFVRVTARAGDHACREEYYFAQQESQPLRGLITGPAPVLTAAREGDTIILKNAGSVPALIVTGVCAGGGLLSDNGLILLPKEEAALTVLRDGAGDWRFMDLAGRPLASC